MGGRRFKFLLRFGIVINLLFGFVSNRVPKTPTIQLNRILEESALLSVHITSNNTVSIVKWIFHPRQGEANDLGRFSNGTWERWNKSDSLGQRLEMVDGTRLKISNLVVKDSGNYTAHVTFSTGVTESHTFSLTVYEPVRELQVTHKLISDTPDGCNVTLRCQASGKGDFCVSWKRGNPLRALGESPDWHQLSDSGEDLHLFWHRNASDANITCLVSNPVDQKNISINLLSLCPAEGANWKIWGIILGIMAPIVAGLICWKRKALMSILQTVFRRRNSTSNATELQEVATSPSASQNGYLACPPSEPDETSDSTPQTT